MYGYHLICWHFTQAEHINTKQQNNLFLKVFIYLFNSTAVQESGFRVTVKCKSVVIFSQEGSRGEYKVKIYIRLTITYL